MSLDEAEFSGQIVNFDPLMYFLLVTWCTFKDSEHPG